MPVPSTMSDLSTTASSNSPAGSENPISTDDFHRAIQAILRHTNAKGSDIASASSIDLGAATGEFVDVTGTTTITSLGTIAAGIERTVRFTGALTLTHNGTSLILPTSGNITTANGDVAIFRSLGSGNWKCVSYIRQDGTPLALPTSAVTLTGTQTLTNKTLTSPLITASTATVATDDKVLILDTNDSDATKTVTAQSIADLAPSITINSPVATTSGTSVTLTSSIPSTAKEINLSFNGISLSGNDNILIRVNGITTGYVGGGSQLAGSGTASGTETTGFRVTTNTPAAARAFYGHATIRVNDASNFIYSYDCSVNDPGSPSSYIAAGVIDLASILTTITIVSSGGSATFDAGSVTVTWK